MTDFEHLKLKKQGRIALIEMNSPGRKVNVLSRAFGQELAQRVTQVIESEEFDAALLISTKDGCFVAGADIDEIDQLKSAKEGEEISRQAQELMNQIAASPKPFVALISGACLGGGLELALACHYRIATEQSSTLLGLPEVMLGLLPGAGGTQRLPRLLGLRASLDLLLTGKKLRARQAKKIGLVDALSTPHGLADEGEKWANAIVSGKIKPPKHDQGTGLGWLEHTPAGKLLISLAIKRGRTQVLAKSKGHYPAPLHILDAVEHGFRRGVKAGLSLEARFFGELAQTSESQSLIRLFKLQTEARRNPFGEPRRHPCSGLA